MAHEIPRYRPVGTPKGRVVGEERSNITFRDYLTYRGRVGMHAWLWHRITGLGVLAFLFLHVLDTALIGWGPAAFNTAMALFRRVGFRIGEILLLGAVLYHALNGVRITVMDLWPQTTVIQKRLFALVLIIFFALYIPSAMWLARGIIG